MNNFESLSNREKDCINNFINTMILSPGLILGGGDNLLIRVQSFIAGLKWANIFKDDDMDEFYEFLCGLDIDITDFLFKTDSGVGWVDHFINNAEGDEILAYKEFIDVLREIIGGVRSSDQP